MGHKATTRGPSGWGGSDSSGGTPAPSDAGYVVTAASGALSNETLIGSIILPPDTLANIPSAAGLVAGTLFHASDEGHSYRADGAGNWNPATTLATNAVGISGDATTTASFTPLAEADGSFGDGSFIGAGSYAEVAPAIDYTGSVVQNTLCHAGRGSAQISAQASDNITGPVTAEATLFAKAVAGVPESSLTLGVSELVDRTNSGRLDASGDVATGYDTQDGTQGLILYSPDGTAWRVTVSNLGVLSTAVV